MLPDAAAPIAGTDMVARRCASWRFGQLGAGGRDQIGIA